MSHDPYLVERREIHVRVLGTPDPIEVGWKTDYRLRPEKVSINWVSTERGPWRLVSVKINGPKLKKDGSGSLNPASKTFFGPAVPANAPDWLRVIIHTHRPEDYS